MAIGGTGASVFVTGTDTGVGKTLVSCAMLHRLRACGLRALGMKPVAAGVEATPEGPVNPDVVALRAASSWPAPLSQVNPYCFEPPVAPHLAAMAAGVRIEIAPILQAFQALAGTADAIVVEGVGGFLVPLNEREDAADMALALALPVVLVVGMRLGCLNHALLTQQAILARSLTPAGWIANSIDPQMARFDENLQALRERIAAPLLGVIRYRPMPDPASIELRLPARVALCPQGCHDEINESAHLRCRQVTRRIKGIKREPLVGPVREKIDQPAVVKQLLYPQGLDLCHAKARKTGAEDRADFGHEESPRGRHLDQLSPALKFPGEGLPGYRVAHLDASVVRQFCRLSGPPVPLQVVRCGDGDDAGVEQLARDQRGRRRLAEANRDVEAFGDQVAELVARDQFERQLRVKRQEPRDMRRQQQAGREGVRVDAQTAPHGDG